MASPASSRRHVAHTVGATLLAGAATYVFLGIVSRSLGAAQYDLFSVYWSISLIVGFGLFLPVEQELSRIGGGPGRAGSAGRAGSRVAVEIAGIAVLLLALAAPLLLAAGVTAELLLITAAFVVVSAAQFAARGFLLASRRFGAYANVLGADALLRVLLAVLVALLLVRTQALHYAAALLAAILVTHLPALVPAFRRAEPGQRAVRTTVRRGVLALLGGTMAAQVLLNVGPLLINAAPVEAGTAGAFLSTFSLARIPLFLLVPLQGALVAPLATLVAEGRTRRMTALMGRLALGIAVLGLVGAVAAYAIGPWIVELVFGPGRSLPAIDVALLVLGVLVHCGLIVTTQALIAAGRHGRASLAWVAAVLVFAGAAAGLWALAGPATAVGIGFLAGSLVGWGLALAELRTVARSAAAGRGE